MISRGFGPALGRGLVLAAAAAAVWVMSRKQSGPAPRLIEWERVRRIATNVSARDRDSLLVAQDGLNERYARMVDRSGALIADYVGQPSPVGARSVHVFDRAAWIDANIANFELLFESIERINTQLHRNGTVGTRLLGEVNRLVLSGQMGVLMGFLARRVLGQYDLTLLGREPLTTGGRLYFVEPNIAGLQRRLGLDGSEFRLWISLHETTHAFEFEAHPWLRTHMNGLLTRYLDSVGADLLSSFGSSSGLVGFARRLGANLRQGGHMLEMLMSAEQRDVFRQLQALMCLVEGYSNHVMDAVGQHLLLSYGPMKRRFEERVRRRSATERLFARVTGLDLKLEQYALGERFVNEVVARRGIPFANRAWQSAWHLPTLDEVRAPERWIARIGR